MTKARIGLALVAFTILVPATLAQDEPAESAGNWLTWSKMTGDWGGARTELAENGITVDLSYTQMLQGNAHGGLDTNNAFRASGTNDLEIKLDTGKMGLWPDGTFILHAETVWGGGIDRKVGSLVPVNLDASLPGSAEPGFGRTEGGRMLLSEWIYQHVLFDGKLILLGGKLWGARAFDTNVFANNENTQFLNTGLRNNPLIPSFLPYTNLGVGAIVNPTPWLSIITAVADTDVRLHVLPSEWNFRTPFFGIARGEVKILHGRGDMPAVAAEVNRTHKERLWNPRTNQIQIL